MLSISKIITIKKYLFLAHNSVATKRKNSRYEVILTLLFYFFILTNAYIMKLLDNNQQYDYFFQARNYNNVKKNGNRM